MKISHTLLLCALLAFTSGCASYGPPYDDDDEGDYGYEREEQYERDEEYEQDEEYEGGDEYEQDSRDERNSRYEEEDRYERNDRDNYERNDYRANRVSGNTAVQNLYDQALRSINSGDYDQAEATLERGLRIEPNNPYLWFELARLSADYGNVKKARELASRAQSLAGGDRYLQKQIQQFMSRL